MSIPVHLKMSVNWASTEHQQSINRASTEHQQSINRASTEHQQSINTVSTECQQSVNTFGCCIMYNPRALLRHISIINVLAAILRKCDRDMVTTAVWNQRQPSVNNFVGCIWYNARAVLWHESIIQVLAAFIGNIVFVDTVTPQNERQQSVNRASR